MEVSVRRRVTADLDACECLAFDVWRIDGYPVYGADDLREFIAVPDALDAWVAEVANEVIGHVALRPSASPGVLTVASEVAGRNGDRMSAISRLVVSPTVRRRGIGALLLATAVKGALDLDRWPILDVVASSPAVAFYDRLGWRRAGVAQVPIPNGTTIDEVVFLWPDPTRVVPEPTAGC